MDNAGDWLYIVFLVIAGISGIYNSIKKKTQEQEQKNQPPITPPIVSRETASDRDFWDIIPYEPEEKAFVKPAKKQKPTKQQKTPTPFLTSESEIERAIRLQGSSGIFNKKETDQPVPPLVSADDFHDPDALKKALIYSEILHRKYE
ncbi:hypothetical protein D0T51_04135 [Parabacteroides sp. 52]|uniref:hypothetical protein n=1 Tax=unclassified Parabacteroides TaxID=2649774 RepID=UPI0013D86694|nr:MULTISPECIES: hypothetical protein [unclassified Parabacteroides]MDH6534178.1 hypothetical protein [Parabacteroides sp. PM5-20]NDV54920.1 hypothetical protein [Parabacteroides sp. 52]